MCGIHRHMASEGNPIDFFKDDVFRTLKTTVDTTMQDTCAKGIGIKRRQAQIIYQDNEDILWERDILGTTTPRALVDTMFWINGIHVGLNLSKKN